MTIMDLHEAYETIWRARLIQKIYSFRLPPNSKSQIKTPREDLSQGDHQYSLKSS